MVKLSYNVLAFIFLGAASTVLGQACDNNNNLSGTGRKAQFITGCCETDADCASSCCSFLRGQCVGNAVALERAIDGGCGHGGGQPNTEPSPAAPTTLVTAPAPPPPAQTGTCDNPKKAGLADGTQFITGCCKSDKDCASGCCSFLRGQCVGAAVAQERANDKGCGFGDPAPNAIAAKGATKRAEPTGTPVAEGEEY